MKFNVTDKMIKPTRCKTKITNVSYLNNHSGPPNRHKPLRMFGGCLTLLAILTVVSCQYFGGGGGGFGNNFYGGGYGGYGYWNNYFRRGGFGGGYGNGYNPYYNNYNPYFNNFYPNYYGNGLGEFLLTPILLKQYVTLLTDFWYCYY